MQCPKYNKFWGHTNNISVGIYNRTTLNKDPRFALTLLKILTLIPPRDRLPDVEITKI